MKATRRVRGPAGAVPGEEAGGFRLPRSHRPARFDDECDRNEAAILFSRSCRYRPSLAPQEPGNLHELAVQIARPNRSPRRPPGCQLLVIACYFSPCGKCATRWPVVCVSPPSRPRMTSPPGRQFATRLAGGEGLPYDPLTPKVSMQRSPNVNPTSQHAVYIRLVVSCGAGV
jgi:hypothetical protein